MWLLDSGANNLQVVLKGLEGGEDGRSPTAASVSAAQPAPASSHGPGQRQPLTPQPWGGRGKDTPGGRELAGPGNLASGGTLPRRLGAMRSRDRPDQVADLDSLRVRSPEEGGGHPAQHRHSRTHGRVRSATPHSLHLAFPLTPSREVRFRLREGMGDPWAGSGPPWRGG